MRAAHLQGSCLLLVSFVSDIQNSFLPCFLPSSFVGREIGRGSPARREAPCGSATLRSPADLPLAAVVIFSTEIRRRCSEVPWHGRSDRRAVVVRRSVKLVHQRIKSGEADMGSASAFPVPIRVQRARHDWPHRRVHRCSARVRCQGPARSHDGSPCANPFRGATMLTVPAALGPSA